MKTINDCRATMIGALIVGAGARPRILQRSIFRNPSIPYILAILALESLERRLPLDLAEILHLQLPLSYGGGILGDLGMLLGIIHSLSGYHNSSDPQSIDISGCHIGQHYQSFSMVTFHRHCIRSHYRPGLIFGDAHSEQWEKMATSEVMRVLLMTSPPLLSFPMAVLPSIAVNCVLLLGSQASKIPT